MRVKVLYFARAREATGSSEESAEIGDGSTAGELLETLVRRNPKLQEIRSCLVLAINQEYADGSARLKEGDEVALIPPISGG